MSHDTPAGPGDRSGAHDPVRLPEASELPDTPSIDGVSRRHALITGTGLVVAAAGLGTWLVQREVRDTEPRAGVPEQERPRDTPSTNPSAAGGDDMSEELQALLDSGVSTVAFPVGVHSISSTLVVPWSVHTLELPFGSVLSMRGDEIALRRSGEVDPRVRRVQRAVEGELEATLDAEGLSEGDWIYLCSDDWVRRDKSKAGMMRRVTSVEGGTVGVDKPLIRTLTTDARAHVVRLAPAFKLIGEGAIENSDPVGTYSNLVRLDFVADIEVSGVELRNCGDAALRTFGTVGGLIDCWIHDCVDDEDTDHYGYGVSCSSTTRDLVVRGLFERVRHAFTTNHGYDAPLASIGQTGEPEDITVAAVVRDTTSTGIDTHEPGYGITIIPDVSRGGTNKWGGINIRARNVTVQGGTIIDSREWGILVQPSASGTVIQDVSIDGLQRGRGIHCKSATTITNSSVSGFTEATGLEVTEGVAVEMSGTTIDGGGSRKARGIVLAGAGCTLSGTVIGVGIGVLQVPGSQDNVLDLTFQQVAREEVVSGG